MEAPGLSRRWKRRIIAPYRRANVALRSPTALLQNENTCSPDANGKWRLTAPNYRNERHALAQEERGEPLRTAQRSPARERRQVILQTSQGDFGWSHFRLSTLLPSRTFSWTPILAQKKRNGVFPLSTPPLGPRVFGMRAFPESLSTFGAHTIVGNRRKATLNLPLTIWPSGSACWKRSGIPPISSWIQAGPY
ncbi:hypothetical protein TcYC6_0073160 [Trypanosoma cruzi]|nr:hypothetical protein TcYC6_0073160 [Trypanosoma cruzi]